MSAASFSSSTFLISASTSSSDIVAVPSLVTTAISMFLDEGSTSSSSARRHSFVVASPSVSSWCFSSHSRTALELRPVALAFHSEYVPLGSVWNSCGAPSGEKPQMSVESPKGRTPPLCVYFCWTPPTYRVMYSTDAESSRVRR